MRKKVHQKPVFATLTDQKAAKWELVAPFHDPISEIIDEVNIGKIRTEEDFREEFSLKITPLFPDFVDPNRIEAVLQRIIDIIRNEWKYTLPSRAKLEMPRESSTLTPTGTGNRRL
jgi:hypothetical protein